MRWHTVNYKAEDSGSSLVDRGWWLSDLPRLMLFCRLRGHRPVVDGFGPREAGLHAARWVVCDRCGVRPSPQGSLDPEKYQVGDPYTGPWIPLTRVAAADAWMALLGLRTPPVHEDDKGKPGPWPESPRGGFGGQVVVGSRALPGFSIGFEVGNCGSEHMLDMHLRLGRLLAIYVHTEQFGTWVQRRFNPNGYDSREFRLAVVDWQFRWAIWGRCNSWLSTDPRWQQGYFSFDLMEKLFGPKRYSYEPVGDEQVGLVRLPEGDQYEVRLLLRRERLGRPRLRWRDRLSWSVQWTATPGIPYREGRSIDSWCVRVDDEAVQEGTWQTAALIALGAKMSQMRTRHGYRPRTKEDG
ncbi:hypothetical protein [Nonomuraea basaltis]|uniref:hypothetical protein n=1 Tax=Nonomuraea basaltis TaxID=2495887 RepID=UPI00110C6501|nr:hypothetical protein [Nonomuraea basaltis]TMR91332.1 hypothetical protein EJK15_50610 [Nonomuraea basaltis]